MNVKLRLVFESLTLIEITASSMYIQFHTPAVITVIFILILIVIVIYS